MLECVGVGVYVGECGCRCLCVGVCGCRYLCCGCVGVEAYIVGVWL